MEQFPQHTYTVVMLMSRTPMMKEVVISELWMHAMMECQSVDCAMIESTIIWKAMLTNVLQPRR